MRTPTTLLVLCLNAVPALCVAQHGHQFEIGAFGSFTRYDHAFNLDNQIGGGGRLGYFLRSALWRELEARSPQTTTPSRGAQPTSAVGRGRPLANPGQQAKL